MASLRCPKCNMAMTDDEVRTGICPICEVVVMTPPAPTPAKTEAPAPARSDFSPALILCTGVLFALAFCLTPIAIFVYNYATSAGPVENKEDAEPPLLATAKQPPKKPASKPPAVEPPESSGTAKQPDDKEKITTPETSAGTKDEPKAVEPKKVEPKKEEPKVVEKKPDVPLLPEVKALPVAGRRGFTCLPLLSDDAIKIDGDLSDWQKLGHLQLNAIERGRTLKKPVIVPRTQKAWVAYCSKGILVAAEVVDTSGAIENLPKPDKGVWPFWDNDGIEVYLDTLNTRPDGRGEPNAHQFFAFPLGVPNDAGIGGYESRIIKRAWTIVSHANTGKTPMLRAGKKTPTGWTLELLIPRSALRHGEIKPGQIFGFELQIDTGTNIYYFWANDDPRVHVSTSPGLWGEAIFGGTDAIVEALDEPKKPIRTVVAGQPLAVRVTDPDRNFNPTVKEKIDVTLVSKSGDRKRLALEETEPNSGIFIGSLATRLGKRDPDSLEVLAGESLIVEYIDPIRANGDRWVTQRTSIPVQSK